MIRIQGFVSVACFLFYLAWKMGAAAAAGDGSNGTVAPTHYSVRIGAVLDSNSFMGAMIDVCISMARWDFYATHADYRTRLDIHRKYAHNDFDMTSAVLELIKNEEVHSILGPQTWTEGKLVPELGGKAHVPVISFTDRGGSLSYTPSPYFIRPAPNDLDQAKAFASICQGFEWHEAVVLYQDTNYATRFLSMLNKAFQDADIRLAHVVAISTLAEDRHIMNELKKLKKMQTRVFLVHMNAVLGSRLFILAKKADMMSEGYAWLVTHSLGNSLNSIDSAAIECMEGVLGLRAHVPKTKNLDNFRNRWKKNMLLMKPDSTGRELNVYGLWAYDTVWALAMAVENIGPVNPDFLDINNSKSGSDMFGVQISQIGPKLVRELQNITFQGLTGEFYLIDGQPKASSWEIFNVFETGDKTIGYWTSDQGIMPKFSSSTRQSYSTSIKELKTIIWPGDSVKQPKGVAIQKLRVGVPKKYGFTQFVNVPDNLHTNQTKITGYSLDIFHAVMAQLNFSVDYYEIIPFTNESGFSNGTYNDLLHNVGKAFDIAVGDITILADRAGYVDFTLPYSESGTVLVVKNKKGKDMWSFVKPFRWDLWLTIISTCIFIGIVLRLLEHRENEKSDSAGTNNQKFEFLFWFPISILAFPEKNMVASHWSRFVLVVWLLMAYIMMQSYTANLSAIFTVDQLDFRFSNDYYIGIQKGSFTKDFLVDRLHVNESKIKEYSTIKEYHYAMNKGSENGGIDAIFDEIPYMKLFLDQYDSDYKIVGTTFRTDGFGFAFPLKSPLVVNFSRAILSVTEDENMSAIEQRNFGPKYSPFNQSDSVNKQSPSLTAFDFGGLFILVASALLFALFCSETSVGQKLTERVRYYHHRCSVFLSFRGNEPKVNSTVNPDRSGDSSSEKEKGPDVSDRLNLDDSSGPGTPARESEQGNADISAKDGQANESESEQKDIAVSARQISS
ncbi:glutamate receptor 2.2-like [Coffea arabica]|uniref:Glutamate receptor n=1 Tax=Coffea arabica TaxID=13443 RepID=A0A6P6SK91_COFAR